MNKLTIKIATAVSSAALVASSFATPLLATTVEISENGAHSDNTVNVAQTTSTTVTQTNDANINNNVNVNANTGGNEAKNNTGGDVKVDTGNSTAKVDVSNSANSNSANVQGCCPSDVSVKIAGNAAKSDNDATVATKNNVTVDQDNTAKIKNYVDVDQNTGDNEANKNTGGDVTVETGDAGATVTVANLANANWAAVTAGPNGNGTLTVDILDNGAHSDNTVAVAVDTNKSIDQDNYANIKNDIDVNANTGYNEANKNTGGDVLVDTGNADAKVDVSNMANFNAAHLEGCGCIDDLLVKVAGNGAKSDNDVTVGLSSVAAVDQDNTFNCGGHHRSLLEYLFGGEGSHGGNCADVYVDSTTGDNEVNGNTNHDGDPTVETGDASADVDVVNDANHNTVGDVDFDFPESSSGNSSLLLLLLAFFS